MSSIRIDQEIPHACSCLRRITQNNGKTPITRHTSLYTRSSNCRRAKLIILTIVQQITESSRRGALNHIRDGFAIRARSVPLENSGNDQVCQLAPLSPTHPRASPYFYLAAQRCWPKHMDQRESQSYPSVTPARRFRAADKRETRGAARNKAGR